MASFNEVINVAGLPENELGHIEYILASPAYEDHFAPYLKRMRDRLNVMLLDPSQAMEDAYPADFLRGGILMIDGLLELFKNLISETKTERMLRSQIERTPNEEYQHMREQGLVRPGGQTEQPAEVGYNPDDDF